MGGQKDLNEDGGEGDLNFFYESGEGLIILEDIQYHPL